MCLSVSASLCLPVNLFLSTLQTGLLPAPHLQNVPYTLRHSRGEDSLAQWHMERTPCSCRESELDWCHESTPHQPRTYAGSAHDNPAPRLDSLLGENTSVSRITTKPNHICVHFLRWLLELMWEHKEATCHKETKQRPISVLFCDQVTVLVHFLQDYFNKSRIWCFLNHFKSKVEQEKKGRA